MTITPEQVANLMAEKIRIAKNDEEYAVLREHLRNRFSIDQNGRLIQIFNGVTFYLYKGNAYFICSGFGMSGKYMHTCIWEYYNGPVPIGFDVHHKDEDQYNNEISNLEIVERKDHLRYHSKKRFQENPEKYLKGIRKALAAKKIWDKSEKAKKFNSTVKKAEGHNKWAKWPIRKTCCEYCGKEFEYKCLQKAKYCSDKCKHTKAIAEKKYHRELNCRNCSKTFTTRQVNCKGFCSLPCWREYRKNNK